MTDEDTEEKRGTPPDDAAAVPYGSNDVRLSPRQCLLAGTIVLLVLALLPRVWQRIEPLPPGADWRIPYGLAEDYWLFDRHARRAAGAGRTLVVGDSVVWGHYVRGDRTLSHCLNAAAGAERFANLGVDGIHPAALTGLLEHYGKGITGRNVVLHCNLLWMSSKRHDLQETKELAFNHPALVPQFHPRIPCYHAPVSDKVDIVVRRNVGFLAWRKHVELAYFGGSAIGPWTIEHPRDNPLRAITLELGSGHQAASPAAEAVPWHRKGLRRFDAPWVELESSIQWRSFRRTLEVLVERGSRVFVLVGPFNEHMLEDASREVYRQRLAAVAAWLGARSIPHFVPPALASDLYADASHPLADGYDLLARQLLATEAFARFDARKGDAQ